MPNCELVTTYHTRRRSIRLTGYDYSGAGVYFVTICSFRQAMLFGEIRGARMMANAIGTIVEATWSELPNRFPSIALDAFAIMPNHLHGIIVLHREMRAETSSAPTNPSRIGTLAHVVQEFKSLAYMRVRRQLGRAGGLWQRNYYEHIVRSGRTLNAIRRYISENPVRWEFDRENPRAKVPGNRSVESWEI